MSDVLKSSFAVLVLLLSGLVLVSRAGRMRGLPQVARDLWPHILRSGAFVLAAGVLAMQAANIVNPKPWDYPPLYLAAWAFGPSAFAEYARWGTAVPFHHYVEPVAQSLLAVVYRLTDFVPAARVDLRHAFHPPFLVAAAAPATASLMVLVRAGSDDASRELKRVLAVLVLCGRFALAFARCGGECFAGSSRCKARRTLARPRRAGKVRLWPRLPNLREAD